MNWLTRLLPKRKPLTPDQRARDLLTAIDAGGLPLHAGIVNDIARKLGLDVPMDAPMEVTIARIRNKIAK
ncbi:MAG TPA: hypothetical protein PKH72_10665 [Rhodoferax sp.]|jgi:hypothetical protein|nr:hypothetical protein [Rhodoferax sp.]HNV60108.1 hypothetical protein [Rhodoferax sp.]HPW29626.1 hypothetical protein [Rhodoferax sp.]